MQAVYLQGVDVNTCIRSKQLEILVADLSDVQALHVEKNSSNDSISTIRDFNHDKIALWMKIRSFSVGDDQEAEGIN